MGSSQLPIQLESGKVKVQGFTGTILTIFVEGIAPTSTLTATEMPGQSERLVDFTLGRPTRTR